MNQWSFVIAAYLLTLTASGGLLGWAHASMQRAEAKAERLREP
ncbi:hypothetical protein ACFQPG_09985 [Sphingomonas sp. GCM10030256]